MTTEVSPKYHADVYRAELERLASEHAGQLTERDANIVGRYLRGEKQSDIGKSYGLGQAAVSSLLTSLRKALTKYENMPRFDIRVVLENELDSFDMDLLEGMVATGNQSRVAKWLAKKYSRTVTQCIVRHRFYKIIDSLKERSGAHRACYDLLHWVADHQYVLQRLEPPIRFRHVKMEADRM